MTDQRPAVEEGPGLDMDEVKRQADEARAAWRALKDEHDRDGAMLTWDEFSWEAGFIRGRLSAARPLVQEDEGESVREARARLQDLVIEAVRGDTGLMLRFSGAITDLELAIHRSQRSLIRALRRAVERLPS